MTEQVTTVITQQRLKELLHYAPETGRFTWLPRPDNPQWTGRLAGKRAGSVHKHGYRRISLWVLGVPITMQEHRLAWLYVYGELPPTLDHINRSRADNRIINLRLADRYLNAQNLTPQKGGSSTVIGVAWDNTKRKWRADIQRFGTRIFLGWHSHEWQAIAARKFAEIDIEAQIQA